LKKYIGDDSAIVTVDVDKTSKKSSKLDDPINMSSEVFHNYLENHITDEHYYKELMCTDVSKVEHDLEGIARQLKGTNERADASILQVYYVLGSQLNNAKARFDELKSNEGIMKT